MTAGRLHNIALLTVFAGACGVSIDPLGELDGTPYYADDCDPDAPTSAAIILAGVKLCPDASVLQASYTERGEHTFEGEVYLDPEVFDHAIRETIGAQVIGLSWVLVDTRAPPTGRILTAGGDGSAWLDGDGEAFRPYNVGAPPGGLPMSPDTFAITGSVSKFVSTMLFLRLLERLEDDAALNPAGLTVPQLLEVPAWHFLPEGWKACIGDAACGVQLDAGESEETENDSFKEVRIRDLLRHTSGLGKTGGERGSSELMWRYLVTGQMKYVVDGDPETVNAVQGSRSYKNVNIYFLAPLTLGLASATERPRLDERRESAPYFGKARSMEAWSEEVQRASVAAMHREFLAIIDSAESGLRYSCDAPSRTDMRGERIEEIAPNYYDRDSAHYGGVWFSSMENQGGCPPQGSYWISPLSMAAFVSELDDGLFDDPRIMEMVRSYDDPAERMGFDGAMYDTEIVRDYAYNRGWILFKGGDQPIRSAPNAIHASSGFPAWGVEGAGHAALVDLPFGHVAFAVVNSDGVGSRTIAQELKEAWKAAVRVDAP